MDAGPGGVQPDRAGQADEAARDELFIRDVSLRDKLFMPWGSYTDVVSRINLNSRSHHVTSHHSTSHHIASYMISQRYLHTGKAHGKAIRSSCALQTAPTHDGIAHVSYQAAPHANECMSPASSVVRAMVFRNIGRGLKPHTGHVTRHACIQALTDNSPRYHSLYVCINIYIYLFLFAGYCISCIWMRPETRPAAYSPSRAPFEADRVTCPVEHPVANPF